MPKHNSPMERKAADWATSAGVSELAQLTASALEESIKRESRRLHFLEEELHSVRKRATELDITIEQTRHLVADLLSEKAGRTVDEEAKLLVEFRQLRNTGALPRPGKGDKV